jgi:hypothetical protein
MNDCGIRFIVAGVAAFVRRTRLRSRKPGQVEGRSRPLLRGKVALQVRTQRAEPMAELGDMHRPSGGAGDHKG